MPKYVPTADDEPVEDEDVEDEDVDYDWDEYTAIVSDGFRDRQDTVAYEDVFFPEVAPELDDPPLCLRDYDEDW